MKGAGAVLPNGQPAQGNEGFDDEWSNDQASSMSGMNSAAAGMMLEMQLARERDQEIKDEFGGETVSIVDQTQFRNVQVQQSCRRVK
jgi:hypothetical protein